MNNIEFKGFTIEAFRFFLHNAGYSTPPGRAACALNMAKAEAIAKVKIENGEWEFIWDYDPDVDLSWDEDGWVRRRLENGQANCYILFLKEKCPTCNTMHVLSALGGIIILDEHMTTDKRMFEAELASEHV